MKFLVLEEVDSTNSYVSRHAAELEDMTMVIADRQTAGRGHRNNSWESAPGRNLTFTLFWRPQNMPAQTQFTISEAVALAMTDVLRQAGIEALVKWPNDIYVGDRKIAGILIEHALLGDTIHHCRIGVGLNVNQREFVSDAPNPVSMANLLGRETDISRLAAAVAMHLEQRLQQAVTPTGAQGLHREFKQALWRGKGLHPYRIPESGCEIMGEIVDVSPRGPIYIRDIDTGKTSTYYFKEIEAVLK